MSFFPPSATIVASPLEGCLPEDAPRAGNGPGHLASQSTPTTTEPEPFIVTRWRCPCCQRTHSSKSLARRHIARCWYNPAARSCWTCTHYNPALAEPEVGWHEPESCAAGVDLTTAAEDKQGYSTLPINCPKWFAERAVTR